LGLPNPFRVPTNAFIESFTGTGQFNTASGSVEVLPPGYAAAIAAQGGSAVAALRPIGLTSGGIEVEGNFDFHVQIDVCTGCLLRCVVGDEEPTIACRPGQNQLTITDDPTLCGP
jgi:hypothetical protein